MNTLKKFISYYRPYRAVFYFDLFCAAVISVVDLAYTQLLRSLTKTLFTGNKSAIFSGYEVEKSEECVYIYRKCVNPY